MIANISFGSEESLFLAGPERDTNSPPKRQAGSLQDSHGLEHDCGSHGIVGGARAGMPRVEVGADHHNLVGFIAATNLSDDVEGVQIVVVKLVLDIRFESNRNILFQVSYQNAVVFE